METRRQQVGKSLVGIFGLMGLAAVLAAGGCGDSGNSGDSAGTYASALESCSAYCEAYVAAACTPTYPTAGQCKISLCSPIPSMASAGCYTATKSWYDCRKAQSDICASGCTDQATAAAAACP
jgi:hypothetical protein